MLMNKIILCLICLLQITWAIGQNTKDSLKNITIVEDEAVKNFYPAPPAKVATVSKDGKSAKGFRVQIFDGNNRNDASAAKAKFMKKYPGIRSYLKFHNPQYRVRVGDFITREEAEAFQEKIKGDFSPSMIIPDLINAGSRTK